MFPFVGCIQTHSGGDIKVKVQGELANAIKSAGISASSVARATGLNAELLRRSLRCERNMTADEYVLVCNYLKQIGILQNM